MKVFSRVWYCRCHWTYLRGSGAGPIWEETLGGYERYLSVSVQVPLMLCPAGQNHCHAHPVGTRELDHQGNVAMRGAWMRSVLQASLDVSSRLGCRIDLGGNLRAATKDTCRSLYKYRCLHAVNNLGKKLSICLDHVLCWQGIL